MPPSSVFPRVLIADDERVIADSLALILQHNGFTTRAVYSGEKAVEAAEEKLSRQRRETLPLAEYQAALRLTIGGFDGSLKQLAGRAADQIALSAREAVVATLRRILTPKKFAKLDLAAIEVNSAAIVQILDAEIDILRRVLATADFLQPE